MQQAVEAGLAQEAFTHEEALSRLDLDKLDLSAEQRDQLTESRSEIRRLKGWAKWGGQQSRETVSYTHLFQSVCESDQNCRSHAGQCSDSNKMAIGRTGEGLSLIHI